MKILVIGLACVLLALALNNAAGLATFVDPTSIIFIFIPTMAAFVAVGFKRQGVFNNTSSYSRHAYWIYWYFTKYVRS